jgi:hypothetical protein
MLQSNIPSLRHPTRLMKPVYRNYHEVIVDQDQLLMDIHNDIYNDTTQNFDAEIEQFQLPTPPPSTPRHRFRPQGQPLYLPLTPESPSEHRGRHVCFQEPLPNRLDKQQSQPLPRQRTPYVYSRAWSRGASCGRLHYDGVGLIYGGKDGERVGRCAVPDERWSS